MYFVEDLPDLVSRRLDLPPGGRALIVLFNNTDADAQARLEFDLNALEVAAGSLQDFETQESFPIAEGTATVPVMRRNFRLLVTNE